MYQSSYFPIFGPEILCPHCRQPIAALTLTDTYLCPRHGAFEADPKTDELVHLQSARRWRQWQDLWYRQHTHADGIRFEIHEELDRLHAQGYRATRILIAYRYQSLLKNSLERLPRHQEEGTYRLYGLPIEFMADEPSWEIINFLVHKEPGTPLRERYRVFDP